MEKNPYDRSDPRVPQPGLSYGRAALPARPGQLETQVVQNQGARQQNPREKMPKARTLALASTLKKWLAVASIIGFGTVSGLAAFHPVGTTAAASQSTQSSSGASQSTPASSSNSSSTNSSSQNSGSFLNQGGNNFGTSSSSQPSTGSSVS